MRPIACAVLRCCVVVMLQAAPQALSAAGEPMPSMGEAVTTGNAAPEVKNQANTPGTQQNLKPRPGWPPPINDSANFTFMLFDNLENQALAGPNAVRWDILGWHGGDIRRLWFKSEGDQTTVRTNGNADFQALYGQLVAPFFDLQAGVRYAQRWGSAKSGSRIYAVVGLQGLSPYRFDIEPALFLSNYGQVSARFTGTFDLLLTQRLILQPRLETNAAAQADEDFGVASGLNDLAAGFRLRYEIRREFAPYVGLSWQESFGRTHALRTPGGRDPAHTAIVFGVRMWR